jgi:hypothetical protein
MQPGTQLDPADDLTAVALAELEGAAQADHETRLKVLEDLYRSLEAQLDSSGTEALR